MDSKNSLDNNKTDYTITDEDGNQSKITIGKSTSDVLQKLYPDNVHRWLQQKYDGVCEKNPELSRRAKGDVVRKMAFNEVVNSLKDEM